jgi:TPP-dependent pyruvate/acetoin dehydrogenase alpha subunit
MDAVAVADSARRAVDAVRSGGGPHFLELRTYRFRAHSMFDPERYRDKAEVAGWVERDPIETLRASLALPDEDWTALREDVDAEMQQAVAFAEAGTEEPVEELTRFVYSEREAAR